LKVLSAVKKKQKFYLI